MDEPARLGRRGFLAAAATAMAAGCLGDEDIDYDAHWTAYADLDPQTPDLPQVTTAPTRDITIEPVLTDLEIAWDLAFDGEGHMYLTERVGRVLRFDADDLDQVTEPSDAITAETAVDNWWPTGGEGGTLGVAVSPDDRYLFVYYTADTGGGLVNRVARYDLQADDVGGTETAVIDDIPAADRHNGGRIAFGPDGYLWVTTGDAHQSDLARDPASLAGKVMRVDVDGDPAPDNPDIDGDDRIYAGGFRNPQGIDWLPDGTPLLAEHGPSARDEVSIIHAGGDYGWDAYRSHGDDDAYGRYDATDAIVPPIAHSATRGWAPSGATWYAGDAIPSWSNRFIVGGLRSQRVMLFAVSDPDGELPPLDDGYRHDETFLHGDVVVTEHQALEDALGRVRHLEEGPEGDLYALTSNLDGRADDGFPRGDDDRVVRLTSST